MTSILHSPETPSDAIFITRALTEPTVADQLEHHYGSDVVERTRENALAWMVNTIDESQPVHFQRGDTVVTIDTHQPIDATIPPTLEDDLLEPTITDKEPVEFDIQESDVILEAVRKAAHEKGTRRIAMDFLARNAPSRTERALRKAALVTAVTLVKHF